MLEALRAVAIAEDEAGVDRLPAQCLDLGNRIHPLHREFDAGMLAAKFTEAVEHDLLRRAVIGQSHEQRSSLACGDLLRALSGAVVGSPGGVCKKRRRLPGGQFSCTRAVARACRHAALEDEALRLLVAALKVPTFDGHLN